MERPIKKITIERPTGPRITASESHSLGEIVAHKANRLSKVASGAATIVLASAAALVSRHALEIIVMASTSAAIHFSVAMGGLILRQQSDELCSLMNVSCAEAYDVTERVVPGYNGPLFQLYNGATTLDIGQDVNHKADMTTWSAFCSGVQSNCKFSKIYAQVHPGDPGIGNNLVPSTFGSGANPDCSGGGPYKCAALFTIEPETGLPIVITGRVFSSLGVPDPTIPISGYLIQLGTADLDAIGVHGPGADLSIVYNGKSVTSAGGMCCGPFGIGHAFGTADTLGTDFFISVAYSQYGQSFGNQCQTATTYCIGIDEESIGDWADYGSNPLSGVIAIITYNQSANKVTASINGTQLINKTPATTLSDNGRTIHLGLGGDLSQPAPAAVRGIIVSNNTLTNLQQAALVNKIKKKYPGLSYH